MKTIYNFFIPLLIFMLGATAFTKNTYTKHIILIQSADYNISSAMLSQSAETISKRLKGFDTSKFDISVIEKKKQIKVTLYNEWDFPTVEKLLEHKGKIEFYETYDQKSLTGLLKGDNHLFSILIQSKPDNSGTKIGCTSDSEVSKVNDYLNTLGVSQKCKFAWTQDFNKSHVCLYALKITGEKGPIITYNDIESAKYENDRIKMKLTANAIGIWAEATKRNLNYVIALVLDDNVISTPKVMSEMNSGELEISGSFTKTQSGYIGCIVNYGVLPVSFKVVK